MDKTQVQKIDLSRKRYAHLADKYYNEGNFVSALRLAYRELQEYGGDPDVFARFADIYEAMGLQGSAINYWFKFLDIAAEEDLPDIYEGLAANFLAIGNENQSAYYYNKLIDVDDTLSDDIKLDIAEAFSTSKKDKFRFVYPPRLADYSKEVSVGTRALKAGDTTRAILEFDKVEQGSKEFIAAKEMQAVAFLLAGDSQSAEGVCMEALIEDPDDVRVLSTLAAVYMEQGRTEESKQLAVLLSQKELTNPDDMYKVATVCCENGMHEEAYERFKQMDSKMPYDGRMLYFKGVAAFKSGYIKEAESTFDELCSIYPDAEVAKYYLRQIREYIETLESGLEIPPPELTYFYHVPQEERDARCTALMKVNNCTGTEAQLFGLLVLRDGYLHWCFDEMDGGDHDLQYLALVTANHVRADEFIQDVLLDFEVADVLKIETLRMLLERNEDVDVGLVLCNIYQKISLNRIKIGRKRRKRFIEGYAKLASKFIVIRSTYQQKIAACAELLYRALEKQNALDLVKSADDCACAIYFLTGFKELGQDVQRVAAAFEADFSKVQAMLACVLESRDEKEEETTEESEEKIDEMD